MFFCSRIINSQPTTNFWFASEYNANNLHLYNGTNGTLNNNNRINSNNGRAVLESLIGQTEESDCLIPLRDFIAAYKTTRRKKRKKISQLLFEFNQAEGLIDIFVAVNTFEYVPKPSIAFLLKKPCYRECIAADFSDRIVQTIFVERLTPVFEENYLEPNSFSCRVGKGSLAAAQNLLAQMNKVTEGGKVDACAFKTDIWSFFFSIDTNLWFPKMAGLIRELYHEPDVELMVYLARIIYQSAPQTHCIMKTPESVMASVLPPHKRMIGRDNGIGVCIGNRASQFLCNVVTTPMLKKYRELGIDCSLYTDDCAGITRNKKALTKIVLPTVRQYIWDVCRLRLHPKKVYIQDASKGINFLAYRIKNGRITPSKRIVHNLRWYITRTTAFYKGRPKLLARDAETVMQVVNSYFGLLKWCSAYRIRRWMRSNLILTEGFGKVFNITDTKITIRKKLTKYSLALEANRKRKLKLKYSLL